MIPTGSTTENGTETVDDLLAHLDSIRERHGRVTVSCEYVCHSGDTFGGEWRGVRVADLLASADPETTHVRAIAADGYCVPVPVIDALETVVATERVNGDDSDKLPRLVGSGIDGSWAVCDLARLEPVSLPANADTEPRFLDPSEVFG